MGATPEERFDSLVRANLVTELHGKFHYVFDGTQGAVCIEVIVIKIIDG